MGQAVRLARIIGGFGLIGLGIVGLALPVLQGIAMIIAGLLLLAREYRWAQRLLHWMKRKWGEARGTGAKGEP
ncbi:MAG: PGPGW domain-containing protein [Terriglobia bacterium]